ncbi:MAG: WYL domain-containing protein [Proteobacteria bacterium]|nr:MAG: WYL domain-containing protein [Pseudomonadota bacterium]
MGENLLSRNERLEELRLLLRQKEYWTAEELADSLGVSIRTLFRYIGELRNKGIDVEADRGRGGGIRMNPAVGSRSVELSEFQAMRLLIATAVLDKLGLPLFSTQKNMIATRLLSGLAGPPLKTLSQLKTRVFIGGPAPSNIAKNYEQPKKSIIDEIEKAFIACYCLEISYRDESNRLSQRVIEPHAISVSWPAWYLLCFDHLRQSARTFRLDRIDKVRPLSKERFKQRAGEIFKLTGGEEFAEPL